MAFNPFRLLDSLEPTLSEHESAFRKAGFQGELRRLSFILYASIALTTLYMFKEVAVPLSRHTYWPLLTVRCFMILIPVVLLVVQRKTVETVLNRPLMLSMAFIIAFNQVLTAFERPLDYPFTSYTSMIVLFILYFAFPFRLATRAGISLAMTLAEACFIIWFKTFFTGGKITVLITYFSFNVIFMYWSASINTMHRKSFMDELRIREAKEQSELLYRSLSHDIRAPMAGLLLGSEQMSNAVDDGDFAQMRTLTDIFGSTLLSSWAMTENLLEWGLLSRLRQADPPETMSMTDIINETLCLFRPLTENRSLTVDLALEDGLSIRSSGRPLRVVVRNLLHNACKFAEAGGCVRIHTRLGEKDQILLSIFNDGEPIPAPISDAGNAAVCVDSTELERRSGTHLGLGICFNTAARQGWDLRLQPTTAADGVLGTEARLTLDGGFIRGDTY